MENDANITVTITITDVNEPPEFPSDETEVRNVVENSSPGDDVGVPVKAEDPEGDTLTHSLDGTDKASFSIDATTGQIKVGVGVTLDHETKPSYTVTVSVHDGNPDNTVDNTITVTINVDDGDEPPVLCGTVRRQLPGERRNGGVHVHGDRPRGSQN